MRRVIIAVPLMLIFVIGVCLSSILFLNNTSTLSEDYITHIQETAYSEDYDECIIKIDEFEDFWKEREKIYLLFIRHDEMHDIEIGIEQMKGFAQCHDKSGIIRELTMLETMLNHISTSELPLIQNII